MRAVWKFPLPLGANPALVMPAGAVILDVQVQNDVTVLWALVDTDAVRERRYFEWVGTGHRVPNHARKYVSTVQLDPLVLHLFEAGGER